MKLGFIGCGNMAGAIISGILSAGLCAPEDIIATDVSADARARAEAKWQIRTAAENRVVAQADIVFIAIKPQYTDAALAELAPMLTPSQLVISIVAGKSLAYFAEVLGAEIPVIRTMPNTPAMVGEGMTALSPNAQVSSAQLETARQIFGCFGKAEVLPENLMPAVVGVSGSSPAYVFMMIESMADAAVAEGMPRTQAYTFAAQAVLGSAKMVLETGLHPGELKDMVCSPAGTTIEAVRVLEETGLRGSLMQAVHTSAEASRHL